MIHPGYTYKLPPRGKQREAIEDHWHEPIHALLCRPGTGKSKMLLDHAGMQYMAGTIQALLIIAPNGVHRQWIEQAVPTHLPDAIPWLGGYYSSGLRKRALLSLERRLFGKDMALRVMSITPEGLQTKAGQSLAMSLVNGYRCMVVNDESHRWANTKTAGWKAARNITRLATTKRIATGTLLRQNPFSAYGQFELMGDALLGYGSLASFKSMYAEMLPPTHGLVRRIAKDFRERTGRVITPQVQARDSNDRPIYRNLPDLRRRLATYSTFMTLADVSGKEPEVIPATRYVELTAAQREMYDALKDLGFTEHAGAMLSADAVLTLSIRLAQVVGGFAPNDDTVGAIPIPGENPKLQELLSYVEELGDEKVIVWAKFRAEIQAIVSALRARYGEDSVVEYHGGISDAQRALNKAAFTGDPAVRYFVANQRAGGTGLDGLQAVSKYMVFYSNDYSYLDREQAIARLARTEGSPVVFVTDIMAVDTIDADIVECMRTAQDVHVAVLKSGMARGTVEP